MWPLNRPAQTAQTTLLKCITQIRDVALRNRIWSTVATINTAENEYVNAAQVAQLHTVQQRRDVDGTVTNEEMVGVYKRMVRRKSQAREIYDDLISSPENGRCPFCGQRQVSTLDHHLPKSIYSALVVTPVNLIPSCGDCNKAKLAQAPITAEDVILHPYFDNIEDHRWLYAEVIEQKPASLRFFVSAPNLWATNPILTQRVQSHFNTLKLDALYRSLAVEEITGARHNLTLLLTEGGSPAVKQRLQETAQSWLNARLNSWQTATYEALANNPWFCAGGFIL